MTNSDRIPLSSPQVGEHELPLVTEAMQSSAMSAPGLHVDGFERELAVYTGSLHAVAVSSGTTALRLALAALGVTAGDEVWLSTLTSAATVIPVIEHGATPVFVDSDRGSWNMDPMLVVDALDAAARQGRVPRAIVLVHLYGQSADVETITQACRWHGVSIVEDAAESLGARYKGRSVGTVGDIGIFSFSDNKIITTSGGGMLVTNDDTISAKVRRLTNETLTSPNGREDTHNVRSHGLCNALAGIGRGQLLSVEPRVAARRQLFARYLAGLGDLPGITFMPENAFGSADSRGSRWLTALTIDPHAFGADVAQVRAALERINVESRPVWKPLHQRPAFASCRAIGGHVANALSLRGICLPSGSSLSLAHQERVIAAIRAECTTCSSTGTPHGHVMRTPLWTRAVRTAA